MNARNNTSHHFDKSRAVFGAEYSHHEHLSGSEVKRLLAGLVRSCIQLLCAAPSEVSRSGLPGLSAGMSSGASGLWQAIEQAEASADTRA
jgi:hypothetical protein